jgi:CMP-N,N'-diacetyllegionaminic acid synthase
MKNKNSKVLAIITARGGSKGLPRKNVLQVNGKPLIAWSIESALQSKVISQVVLSSDDSEIIDTARAWGCPAFLRRPDHLATDTANSVDVVLHALQELPEFDYVILLQPTSPLRTSTDIDEAFNLLQNSKSPSCVSLCESEQSPYLMFHLQEKMKLRTLLQQPFLCHRRQDLPKVYVLNGAIYIAKIEWFLNKKKFIAEDTIGFIMNQFNSLDIDTAEDFERFRIRVSSL